MGASYSDMYSSKRIENPVEPLPPVVGAQVTRRPCTVTMTCKQELFGGAEYLFAGIDCKGPLTSVVSGFMKPKTALKNSQGEVILNIKGTSRYIVYRGAHSDQPLASMHCRKTSGGWTILICASGQHFRVDGTILSYGGGSQWFMFLGESREDGRLIATFSRSPRSPYSRTEQWSISLAAGIDATFTAAIAVVLHKLEVVEQQRRSAMISAALLA